ncbi:MAG: serine/threonine protein kinase [Anaerolineales bacterium]|nr:serine/threonine protein kinase [Anaerolineales bacterium]
MTEWVGQTLSKVLIEKRIGRGGMAEVYLGHHGTLKRAMVVKILYAYLSADPRHLTRFHTEAQAVAALRHPNIVQVFDFDIVNGQPYILMELLDGISLEMYMHSLRAGSQTMPRESVVRLIKRLAEALDYAHGEGVIHRDIKPANVMLCHGSTPIELGHPLPPDVEPVLTDFGLAQIGFSSEHTEPGTIMGTPAYMSPEQVEGRAVSVRTDLYALGVLAYEMLSGELPFKSAEDTPASIMYQQVHTPPPSLPSGGAALDKVMKRALSKQPENRYAFAADFAADLENAITLETKTTPFRMSPRIPRRMLYIALGVVLVAIASIFTLTGDWFSIPTPESDPNPATLTTLQLTENPQPTLINQSPTEPTPEPTPEEDARANLDLDNPDYTDPFEISNGWTQYDVEGSGAYRVEGGELFGVDYVPEEKFTYWSILNRQSGNVYAEVSATNGDCIGKDSVGIVIRIDEEKGSSGYALEVSCDGSWRVRLHRESKSPRMLSNWSSSAAIHTGAGATNRLGVLGYRDRFYVFINDQPVSLVFDPEYSRSFGSFALYVRASHTFNLGATFDDFSYWHIRYVP